VEVAGEPFRRVRADLFAASVLIDASAPAGSPQATLPLPISPAVRTLLDQQLAALDAADHAAATRFVDSLAFTEWGAPLWLDRLPATLDDVRELSEQESTAMRLRLTAWSSASGETGERADRHLVALSETRTARPEAWPSTKPAVATRAASVSIGFRAAARNVVGDSPLQDVHAETSYTGRRLRFSGAGENRPWEPWFPKREPRQDKHRSFGGFTEYQRVWFVGPLVLFQDGTQMWGGSPFKRRGERGATLIWPPSGSPAVDTWGEVDNMHVGFLPRISDMTPGAHLPDLDEFGRPLAQIGPVCAGYFCLREFGRLVAYETATGRRLWEREGFGKHDRAFGGDQTLVVWSGESQTFSVLRPLDGLETSQWQADFSPEELVSAVESTGFVLSRHESDEAAKLRAIDFSTGAAKWTCDVDPSARPFAVGRRLIGVVEPSRLRLFDQKSGAETSVPVETPPEIDHAAAIADGHAVIILASGPATVGQTQIPLSATGGPRRPWANGRVYGLDPETLALRWTIALEETVLPLDQPPDVPIFVINDAVPPDRPDAPTAEGRLRCYDKRSGELLYEGLQREIGRADFVVERGEPGSWVDVRTSKSVVRFDYRQ
jgi:hypothetical protein